MIKETQEDLDAREKMLDEIEKRFWEHQRKAIYGEKEKGLE